MTDQPVLSLTQSAFFKNTYRIFKSRQSRPAAALFTCSSMESGETFLHTLFRVLECTAINPEQDSMVPCGSCQNCNQSLSDTLSPYTWVRPSSNTKSGSIDRANLEDALEKVKYHHSRGPMTLIICGAHLLTLTSSNHLLKLIEEPGSSLRIVMLSSSPLNVLITLRSRCQTYSIPPWDRNACLSQLSKSGEWDPHDNISQEHLLSTLCNDPFLIRQYLNITSQLPSELSQKAPCDKKLQTLLQDKKALSHIVSAFEPSKELLFCYFAILTQEVFQRYKQQAALDVKTTQSVIRLFQRMKTFIVDKRIAIKEPLHWFTYCALLDKICHGP